MANIAQKRAPNAKQTRSAPTNYSTNNMRTCIYENSINIYHIATETKATIANINQLSSITNKYSFIFSLIFNEMGFQFNHI